MKANGFELQLLTQEHTAAFKADMQHAFRQGAEEGLGYTDAEILPESHIDHSLSTPGAIAYVAIMDGNLVGGAIVVIHPDTQHNHLDFLYVKDGIRNKGLGLAIWRKIEALHPDTKVWETCTPYFDKRNIHFYTNKCAFHIVEFYNEHHQDPHDRQEHPQAADCFTGMFRFEKVMPHPAIHRLESE